MATWKKVIVSGSNISQLANDAGYVTSAEVLVTNTFATMSINGVNVIADSNTDTLTFASASGVGLNISGNASTDTITFTLGNIPNTSLTNSSVTVTAGGGLSGGGAVSLGGSTTLSVNSGSMLPFFTGSVFSTVSGDITISSAGVASIAANSVALGTDTTGNYVASLGTGTGVTIGANTGEGSQPTIAVIYGTGSNTSVQGNTNATINVTAGELTLDAGTAAQALGSGPSWTLGLADTITGNRTFSNDLIIGGNLTVNGTASYINVTNIFVEDPFILLASGSTGTTDGGIIIDRGSAANGNIGFGFDSATSRWGVQDGLTDLTTGIDLGTSTNGISGSFIPYLFVETNHGATKPITGEFAAAGAMYMSSVGDFWIYTV